MTIIEVKDLSFTYEDKETLHNLTFEIEKNSINVIFGLSGCGKTTLCYCLCGIIPKCIGGHWQGEIKINGESIKNKKLSNLASVIGFVMQNPDNQLVTTSVEDELSFGPENMLVPREEIEKRVEQILDLLQINDLRYENPNRLSGGQKQMVAIGSILSLDPQILILDEPMSHLDSKGKNILIKLLKVLQEMGKTIIIVDHDYLQLDFAHKWLLMENGAIKSFASPQEMMQNKQLLVEAYLG